MNQKPCTGSAWLVVPKPNPAARLRLICLPYAGGNAATYASWPQWLVSEVELIAVQLPGRVSRMADTAFSNMQELVTALHSEIHCCLDKPYLLFGHSLGSRLGFELLKSLERDGCRLPAHFIASGGAPAHVPLREAPMHQLDDAAFIESLRRIGGTPEAILQSEELMALLLPTLRSDFKVAETRQEPVKRPVDCALSLFAGDDDNTVLLEDMYAWRDCFQRGGEFSAFPGGHMFVDSAGPAVVEKINRIIYQLLRSR